MPDQADRLRQLAQSHHGVSHLDAGPPIVLVTGAKTGVGTSTVASHLAACLRETGIPTALVDVNTESAHVSDESCSAVATNAKEFVEQLHHSDSEAELLVVDGGTGIDAWSESLWRVAKLALLVTTPDEQSIVDTYAEIKLARQKRITTPLHVTVNQAAGPLAARDVHARIAETCRRFLGESVPASPPLPLVSDWRGEWNSESTCPAWNAAIGLLARHVAKSLAIRCCVAA